MKLTVGTDFELERDLNCWVLHHWTDGLTKDGNPKRSHRMSYYSKLEHACQQIIDRRAGMAEKLDDVVAKIDEAKAEICVAINSLTLALIGKERA